MDNGFRLLFVLFCGFLGASIGSFLEVVATRTLEGRSWWGRERSTCASCGAVLKVRDLIPVVSYLLLKGRCRTCQASIPFIDWAAETLCGVVCVLLALRWQATWGTLFAFLAFFHLFLNALTDFQAGTIFDLFALVPGGFALTMRLFWGWAVLLDGIEGALLGFGLIAVIIVVSRGGMGWGDALLMGGSGAFLGWKLTAVALYLGFMTGGGFVLLLLAAHRVKRRDAIPLVPFLSVGGVLALLWGPSLVAFLGLSPSFPWI